MRIQTLLTRSAGLFLAAALLPTVGCGKKNVDLADIIPEDRAASINVPGGGDGQALLGARSDFYETTYNVSRGINGGVVFVLALSREISKQDPTTVDGNTYVWGPSEPSGLERVSWRFTAVEQAEGHWTFKLDGRQKGQTQESDFKTIYDGDVTRGEANPNRGHGTLNLYFDNAQAVEEKTCGNGNRDVLTGRAAVTFAADVEPKHVEVAFTDFSNTCDTSPRRTAASYAYSEAADGSGNFQFSADGNIHKATENKPGIETLTIRSRWAADGKGRSDVAILGEEVAADLLAAGSTGTQVTATECWDENFDVVYQTTGPTNLSVDIRNTIRPTEGSADACIYTDLSLPSDV